ncbi:MAG: PD-(D/E)XK nuclease family protein, partial [Treponema sp.]|nr:PD-(D/E)XK nuclease family protein [Treponema sp.]
LALRFSRSPLGIIAGKTKQRKSEFPFRSLIYDKEGREIFINGIIDLVFEDGETVYVVDFKTDKKESPEDHIPQMASYYRAATELFALPEKKKCRIWLYYLRTGHAVELSAQAGDFFNGEIKTGKEE